VDRAFPGPRTVPLRLRKTARWTRTPRRPATGADDDAADDDAADVKTEKTVRRRRSLSRIRVSLTAVVTALLVVLIGVGTWLFVTRPVAQSPIELTAVDEILSAARSGIVDVTSFDYLTLD